MEITITHRPDLGDDYHFILTNEEGEVSKYKLTNIEAVTLRDFLNKVVK